MPYFKFLSHQAASLKFGFHIQYNMSGLFSPIQRIQWMPCSHAAEIYKSQWSMHSKSSLEKLVKKPNTKHTFGCESFLTSHLSNNTYLHDMRFGIDPPTTPHQRVAGLCTCDSVRTPAAEAVELVCAGASVQTRLAQTLVHFNLAVIAWKQRRRGVRH